MPKQFEGDKKQIERSKKSRDILHNFKNQPRDSHYSSKGDTNREAETAESLYKKISKATVSTFLNI